MEQLCRDTRLVLQRSDLWPLRQLGERSNVCVVYGLYVSVDASGVRQLPVDL